MKKYLRLLCMLLTLSMCAGMILACGNDKTPDDDANANELAITDDFVIVQPAKETDAERKAASKIHSALSAAGISLTVQDDSTEAPKNEILVGNTARPESQEALNGLNNGDYLVKLTGDADNGYKIVVAATMDSALSAAAEYFINTYLSGDNAGKVPLDLLYNYKCVDVKVAGTPISAYTIVYAKESATVSDKQIQAAKYADTVEVFADLIEGATGKRPEIVPDTTRIPDGTKTILFGKTALADDDAAYTEAFASEGAYTASLLENGTVVLAGNNACSVLAAGEAFAEALRNAPDGLDELNISAEKDLIKVACIGDSITYGTNSSDTSMMNYPVYLQRLLGYDYYVEKYGAPSHSLIETDTQSILKHNYYNMSLNAAPDVVIAMLGTNDCRTQKWDDSKYKDWTNPQRTANFLAAGEKLINDFRAANPDVQIIWTTLPTVPQDAWLGSDWTQRIKRYGNPLIQQLAAENNCQIIDVFTFSENHPEMFEGGDGLHPQNEQYGILAQGIYDMVKDFIKKPE